MAWLTLHRPCGPVLRFVLRVSASATADLAAGGHWRLRVAFRSRSHAKPHGGQRYVPPKAAATASRFLQWLHVFKGGSAAAQTRNSLWDPWGPWGWVPNPVRGTGQTGLRLGQHGQLTGWTVRRWYSADPVPAAPLRVRLPHVGLRCSPRRNRTTSPAWAATVRRPRTRR